MQLIHYQGFQQFFRNLVADALIVSLSCLADVIADLFTFLDDPDRVYRAYPHMLSGGMLQRVIIAMAMMLDAKFVLADEPTTALDVIHRNGIIDLFSQMKANGVGILMVTHDFATALQLGGNVLVMKEGKIIESGEVQSVFDHTTEPYTRSLIEAYSLSCAFTKGAES